MRCPLCKMEFENSVKVYRKFCFKQGEKIVKVAYKEERCPFCGYPIEVKEMSYDAVKTKPIPIGFKYIEEYLETLKELKKQVKKLFDDISEELESFIW